MPETKESTAVFKDVNPALLAEPAAEEKPKRRGLRRKKDDS